MDSSSKIPALVLSHDPHMPFVDLIVSKYRKMWRDDILQFKVPLNDPKNVPLRLQNVGSVSFLLTDRKILSTMQTLLVGVGDDDWVFWCISDRYPIALVSQQYIKGIVGFLNSDASAAYDVVKLFHWREEIMEGQPEHIVAGIRFAQLGCQRCHWGFWHHQFMRGKVLRDAFFSEEREEDINALNRQLVERYRGGYPFKVLLPVRNLAKFGESLVRGEITVNGRYELMAHGIDVPDVPLTRRTKSFISNSTPCGNRFWNRHAEANLPFSPFELKARGYCVVSPGGVGSKMLIKGITAHDDAIKMRARHYHLRFPPLSVPDGTKVVYMFGDPRNAVNSFLERRDSRHSRHGFRGKDVGQPKQDWAMLHCRNIESDPGQMDETWDLDRFLENGWDHFRLEEHFDNWFYSNIGYEILFVRYETIWDHVDLLSDLLDFDKTGFPEKIDRRSDWRMLDAGRQARMNQMYGHFAERVARLPDVFAVRGGCMTDLVKKEERPGGRRSLARRLREIFTKERKEETAEIYL